MANWKEGERVRVVSRAVSDEDRKTMRYFEHMAGLTGVVQNVYAGDEIAVKVDLDTLSKVTSDVHAKSTLRMREKFVSSVSEEQRKHLTKEELEFVPHYMLLVQARDLEKI